MFSNSIAKVYITFIWLRERFSDMLLMKCVVPLVNLVNLKKIILALVDIVGLFGALSAMLGGCLTIPAKTITFRRIWRGRRIFCNWSCWLEVSNACGQTCGKSNRKGKVERRYFVGDSCQKRSENKQKEKLLFRMQNYGMYDRCRVQRLSAKFVQP